MSAACRTDTGPYKTLNPENKAVWLIRKGHYSQGFDDAGWEAHDGLGRAQGGHQQGNSDRGQWMPLPPAAEPVAAQDEGSAGSAGHSRPINIPAAGSAHSPPPHEELEREYSSFNFWRSPPLLMADSEPGVLS